MSKVFIDSNIWIYAFVETDDSREKTHNVITLLESLRKDSTLCISVQVLNEFHWVLKRKYGILEHQIKKFVDDGILEIAEALSLEVDDYRRGYSLREKYHFSYWDSLIVSSALKAGCKSLYSEDMQHRLKIEDTLTIRNPFKEV